MRKLSLSLIIVCIVIFFTCKNQTLRSDQALTDSTDNTSVSATEATEKNQPLSASATINTRNIKPETLISYAKTLIGTPYKYGSILPQNGLDCSGFITHVFNHFDIAVPRSSVDFTDVGLQIPAGQSKPGDLILFTGTDSTKRVVGHMGIIVSHTDSIYFIHSTSGKAYGVTITPLNSYYQGRFVKTIRIFK